jgi:Arc/MetJ-type ribon-helix-helix transcriptional regulator
MITIPVQIYEIELVKIDTLVKLGRFKSRNQAIRSMLLERLSSETIILPDDTPEKAQKRQQIIKDFEIKKIPFEIILIESKSAANLISEERER